MFHRRCTCFDWAVDRSASMGGKQAIMAGIAPVDARFFDAETMAALARQVMLKAAARGDCVIVGRGARARCRVVKMFFTSSSVLRGRSALGVSGRARNLARPSKN